VDDLGNAAIVSINMASMKEKAQCVFWYHETKSPLTVQRNFRREYGRIRRRLRASQIGMQSLKRLAMLVTVEELVGLL
jgi:hypothetical protein